MASSSTTAFAIFLTVNVLFFSLVSACDTCRHWPKPTPTPSPRTGGGSPGGSGGGSSGGSGSSGTAACPRDALKLGVCANVLNGLINATVGAPPKTPCCPLIQGLADLEAAVCLCTAIKANILGINLNLPISLSLVLGYCGKGTPKGFQCA